MPDIIELIKQDLQNFSDKQMQDFSLIRAKSGVYVYRCRYDGVSAVVKYLEKEDDRREISNYQMLIKHGIPTIKTLVLANATLVMEDISVSQDWRLGIAEDLDDVDVAKSLAEWYFIFHEKGFAVPELDSLFFEYDSITVDNLKMLSKKLPQAKELFQFLLDNYDKLHSLIYKPAFTLAYNDFYWENFVVRKDKKAAMMFDYNLLGKGYRSMDFSNVCSSLSDVAGKVFMDEYDRLYLEKYGRNRVEEEKLERQLNDVLAPLYALIVAYTERESFPDWAKGSKEEVVSGSLLPKAKKLGF